MKALLALTTAALTFALASPAVAGEYTVRACAPDAGNASWYVDVPYSQYVTSYTSCPGEGIVTRMSGGSGNAPYGASSRHTFVAPPGTWVKNIAAKIKVNAERGWYAGFVDWTPRWIWCGASCSSWDQYWDFNIGASTQQVFMQVTCGNGGGCPRSGQYGIVAMQDVKVTVGDNGLPGVDINGGSVTAGGWRRGDQDVHFATWDDSGLQTVHALVDGVLRGGHSTRCDWAKPRPCQNEQGRMTLTGTDFVGDGAHRVTVRVEDAAKNSAEAATTVLVDQTPPGQALDTQLEGGDGWRIANDFAVRWRNPPQSASPINTAHYAMCPVGASSAGGGCKEGTATAQSISSLANLRVPAPGAWQLSIWLQDEAGNTDRERSAVVGTMRQDDTPPEASIAPQSDDDPTRVRVIAKDATSGVADVAVEARREGETAWRSFTTARGDGGFSATLDDSVLPRGRYVIRARVVDNAGNERSTQRQPNGDTATRTLPLRIATRLAVGRPRRVSARGAHGKRRVRTVLQVRPQTRFGRTIPIRGRLTMPGGNPLATAVVEVWERVKLPRASWRRISVLRTSRTGRFRFKALSGPEQITAVSLFRHPNDPGTYDRGRPRRSRHDDFQSQPFERREWRGDPLPRTTQGQAGRRHGQAAQSPGVHPRALVHVRDPAGEQLNRVMESPLPVQRHPRHCEIPVPSADPTRDGVPVSRRACRGPFASRCEASDDRNSREDDRILRYMTRLRAHITYGNVTATFALFIALGGTSYAVAQLPGTASARSRFAVALFARRRSRTGPCAHAISLTAPIALRDLSVSTPLFATRAIWAGGAAGTTRVRAGRCWRLR